MRESASPAAPSAPRLTPTSDSLLASYEAVPYESRPIPYTEPDSIAANAILHGVTPPPPDRCRVLELGCASGGNLISMAYSNPKSQFLGDRLGADAGRGRPVRDLRDGSPEHTARGQEHRRARSGHSASSTTSSATACIRGCRPTFRRRFCACAVRTSRPTASRSSATTRIPAGIGARWCARCWSSTTTSRCRRVRASPGRASSPRCSNRRIPRTSRCTRWTSAPRSSS